MQVRPQWLRMAASSRQPLIARQRRQLSLEAVDLRDATQRLLSDSALARVEQQFIELASGMSLMRSSA